MSKIHTTLLDKTRSVFYLVIVTMTEFLSSVVNTKTERYEKYWHNLHEQLKRHWTDIEFANENKHTE